MAAALGLKEAGSSARSLPARVSRPGPVKKSPAAAGGLATSPRRRGGRAGQGASVRETSRRLPLALAGWHRRASGHGRASASGARGAFFAQAERNHFAIDCLCLGVRVLTPLSRASRVASAASSRPRQPSDFQSRPKGTLQQALRARAGAAFRHPVIHFSIFRNGLSFSPSFVFSGQV